MLYKKVHRLHVRDFRVGRKFMYRFGDKIFKITSKPYIDYSEGCISDGCIRIKCDGTVNGTWDLIVISDDYFGDFSIGEIIDRDNIIWLED